MNVIDFYINMSVPVIHIKQIYTSDLEFYDPVCIIPRAFDTMQVGIFIQYKMT